MFHLWFKAILVPCPAWHGKTRQQGDIRGQEASLGAQQGRACRKSSRLTLSHQILSGYENAQVRYAGGL